MGAEPVRPRWPWPKASHRPGTRRAGPTTGTGDTRCTGGSPSRPAHGRSTVPDPVTSRAEGASGVPQALVVVPTRELAGQVTGDLEQAGSVRGVRVLSVYGGRAIEPQIAALRKFRKK